MRPDFGDLVRTGRKNECIFTLHFAKSNIVDFQKLRWVVQETVNEVIPAGEAEWREGNVCIATKFLTLATLE